MTNLLTPLKKLGKKMTGQDISGSNLVTVVDDIANKYDGSGGGGGEGGGGGCDCQPVIAHAVEDPDEGVMSIADMTAGEMYSFAEDEKPIIVVDDSMNYYYIKYIHHEENQYSFGFSGDVVFVASSADDYPVSGSPK